MPLGLVSTRKLVDKKVFGGKDHAKHLGKVKAFIFHPQEKRCVGFVVKRPDVALMFHREDLFVAFDAFTVEDDGDIYVSQKTGATGDAACKRLGVDWNTCLVWRGLPVVTEAGETIGIVGDVLYDGLTGDVRSMKVDAPDLVMEDGSTYNGADDPYNTSRAIPLNPTTTFPSYPSIQPQKTCRNGKNILI